MRSYNAMVTDFVLFLPEDLTDAVGLIPKNIPGERE